ncbi:fimbria/pilus periplasmic chaperone [Stenotrophomonas sp. SAU14A_NAIMI4_8]|uniref:fimbrial biogenesis chaperone n=1 Tax=Stenotrophomonas sp. SAU14A_NAIMI4_8 TaxID=2072409 RepID=UPI0019005749|nr:fimbria/pilus periplasmic chaperone [Stenotrophomonas sp. SAU14A_NAIMI4_8]
MRSIFTAALALGLASTFVLAPSAHAGVVIEATRVVYPAQEREVTIKLNNRGERPVLVQTWLDNGDASASPESIRVPFNLTPPMARMDPKAAQVLRLMHTGEAMPSDRETLYWLNVYEIPSRKVGDEQNMLQIALRTRIKVFYRPAKLAGDTTQAIESLKWSLVDDPDGGGKALQVENPSPYHVNFFELGLRVGEKTYGQPKTRRGGMVAPFASTVFALDGVGSISGKVEVVGKTINDFGGNVVLARTLSP